ncbi:unnamed protein product [Coffea canephora]|uniref:DH200=94 genomic scaffold, scaffold_6344 n=1 Tax=Coffea canephora TaxID=49390 RepID=A0A068VME7_COFCA|nr:unnamed protein product [Coffea canephora]
MCAQRYAHREKSSIHSSKLQKGSKDGSATSSSYERRERPCVLCKIFIMSKIDINEGQQYTQTKHPRVLPSQLTSSSRVHKHTRSGMCIGTKYIFGDSRHHREHRQSIQVFLSDLVSNDFNSIFRSLPNFYQRLGDYYERSPGSCFIAAMPGSFHGRLFPDNSMHFVYSSYSLHWLSQVPSGLVTAGGLPLNKGNIYIGKTSPMSVHDAYLDQFGKDFTIFLTARAAEMVSGGHLFLSLQSNNDDPLAYNYPDLLGMTMNDMVSEVTIHRHSFSIVCTNSATI